MKRNKIKNNYRITVAQLSDKYVHSHGGNVYVLKFKYKDKKFKGGFHFGLTDTSYTIRKRFFIQFNPQEPNVSAVIKEIIVPDSIKFIPDTGWKELPIKVPNKYYKYLLKKYYNLKFN